MVIDRIIIEEKRRNEKMRKIYEQELDKLPRGSLYIKEQNGKTYCYLRYRKDGKIVAEYMGGGENEEELKKGLARRKHLQAMLKSLEKEYDRMLKMEKIK